ncbi:major capsid protein [Ralstonia mojiangensis]|uniref:major capsid protein n=1 Tax=Ralstonia mojiangensis TaxID=2953895 RepID=UPI00209044C1|nr:major capsid protein [Ralstonia mojiangensis]MCO5415219.1 phage coat protein [Ralstonia mojiangensis]
MNKFSQVAKRVGSSVYGKTAVVAGGLGLAGLAHADGPDVSAVVAVITGGLAAIGLIGVAVLSVYGTIAIYNWVKRPIK